MIEMQNSISNSRSLESASKPKGIEEASHPRRSTTFTLNLDGYPKEDEDKGIPLNIPRSIFSQNTQRLARLMVFFGFLGLLIASRYIVPSYPNPSCVADRVLDALKFANDFLYDQNDEDRHRGYRNAFQLLCSFLVDCAFIITFGYWVTHAKTSRLPIALGLFYGVRALIQQVWESPFPPGFYWNSPGLPSLVVPYGRGSDFFFSGHSGFMLICAEEWHRLKKPVVRNLILAAGTYTVMILLIYRIHYSIDVFVGLFFADWCFWTVDTHRHRIDKLWVHYAGKVSKAFDKVMHKDDRVLIES